MGRGRSELARGPLDWVGSKLEVPVRQTAIAPGGVSLLDFQASRGIPSEADAEGNRDKRTAREEAFADGKRSPEDVDAAIAGASKVFYKAPIADTDAAIAAATAPEKASDERFGRDAPSFARLRSALEDIRRVASPILAQKLIDDPDPIVEEPAGEDGARAWPTVPSRRSRSAQPTRRLASRRPRSSSASRTRPTRPRT